MITDLTVEEGAVLSTDSGRQMDVLGTVVNRGRILGERGLILTHGDVLNEGEWTMRLWWSGSGPRTVRAPGVDGQQYVQGNVFLEGRNVVTRVEGIDDSGGQLTIEKGGVLEFTQPPEVGYAPYDIGTPDDAQFFNLGTVIVPNVPTQFNGIVVGSNLRGGFEPGVVVEDTVWAETYSDQSHPAFANAVRRWWRFRWSEPSDPSRPDFFSLVLTFEERHLGDLDPDSLSIYHSPDGGETWVSMSDGGLPVQIDGQGVGFAILQYAPSSGDYVVASKSPPTAARPVAHIQIQGRNQIRVGGPPNRYRVHYTNSGSQPMGRTLLGLRTEGGVHINRVFPSSAESEADDGGWGPEIFSPQGDSTEAMLMTSPLGPGESRTFTVFLSAVPDVTSTKTAGVAVPAVVGGVVVGIGFGYLSDLAFHALEEVMADPCNNTGDYQDKFNTAFDRTDDKWNPFGNSESPWLAATENGASALAESGGLKSGFGALTVVNLLGSAASTVANGTSRYEQNSGRSMFQPVDCDPPPPPNVPNDRNPLDPVSSFDPNSKVGPGGTGERNYVASVGRMEYTINFENKAEATAPAYRIVIVDTLGPQLDPTSIRLGATSHDGWDVSIDGNIITWDIVGIELPPNVTPPEGEGFVSFSVNTVPGLGSGDAVANRAEITFDLNEPILTNTHVNVLDYEAPVTTMSPLPPEVQGSSVILSWSAADPDNGSGVASAAVYASAEGGAFELVGYSDGNQLAVPVEPNVQYAFYTLSSDSVGNVESSRPTPVSTRVVATSVEDQAGLEFDLAANYPNPFGQSTSISFAIPSPDRVSVSVFDLLGREVARIVDEMLPAGKHTVEWRPSTAASGVYFYRLKAGERTASRSMIVVR
jgi:hypothetical protein